MHGERRTVNERYRAWPENDFNFHAYCASGRPAASRRGSTPPSAGWPGWAPSLKELKEVEASQCGAATVHEQSPPRPEVLAACQGIISGSQSRLWDPDQKSFRHRPTYIRAGWPPLRKRVAAFTTRWTLCWMSRVSSSLVESGWTCCSWR
jgi:hypothetical protein